MIVLDRSGSMDSPPDGGFSGTSKLDLSKVAINMLLTKYGNVIPFGFTTFNDDNGCDTGIDILVEPKHGTSSTIGMKVAAVVSGGGTNTGQAVKKVAADPAMHDAARPGSYILLITDGEPLCGANGLDDPAYTVSEIKAAATASQPVKTFVIGFGALPTADQMAMDQMAAAGGEPCSGPKCNGHQFYAADSADALNAAIDAITQQITGEFGGTCDDSCYANGCPSAGQICVMGACKTDPCATLRSTCAPGDYCFTDGTSPGTCVHACNQTCPSGQVCTPSGMCQADPCATASCPAGQVCRAGQCIADQCKTSGGDAGCDPGLVCYQGKCIDDPCRYVQCPSGTACVMGTGACGGTGGTGGGTGGTGGGGGPRDRSGGGCELGGHAPAAGLVGMLLVAVGLLLVLRRRRA
jgi:hypothetical protein